MNTLLRHMKRMLLQFIGRNGKMRCARRKHIEGEPHPKYLHMHIHLRAADVTRCNNFPVL